MEILCWMANANSNEGGDKIQKIVEKLIKHVYTLSQIIGSRSVDNKDGLDKAGNYIEEQFCCCGYKVERQYYRTFARSQEMATLTGGYRE